MKSNNRYIPKINKHIFFFKKKKKLTQLVLTRFKMKKFRKFDRDLTRNQEEIKITQKFLKKKKPLYSLNSNIII